MLFCLTANHRNTEFDVLDRISRISSATAADILAEHDYVTGAIVLATCNRFEAYIELDEPLTAASSLAAEAVFDALAIRVGADAEALRRSATALSGDEVVHHLFAVSSGLESMVVGEEEIGGQVQRALATAREAGTTSSGLERLFQRAAHTSREVRAQVDLGASGRSLSRIALDLAESRIPDWSGVPILVVGTGSYAATTIRALQARGADDLRVFSATGRADTFAIRFGIVAERDLRAGVAAARVIITCTARYTLKPDDFAGSSPRLVIDLGLPRNVDPAVEQQPGVELLDLERLGRHASLPELGAGVHSLVGSAAVAFTAESEAAPAIVALRAHVHAMLEGELDRVQARGGDEQAEAALRHLAGVLLHGPSVRARELAAEGRLGEFEAALDLLFGVQIERRDGAGDGDQVIRLA